MEEVKEVNEVNEDFETIEYKPKKKYNKKKTIQYEEPIQEEQIQEEQQEEPIQEEQQEEQIQQKIPKPRTEKQKIAFMKLQEKQQLKWAQKRLEKNNKLKEIVLKQVELEKHDKILNAKNKKIKKIIKYEFEKDDTDILKKMIEKQKENEKEINYGQFF